MVLPPPQFIVPPATMKPPLARSEGSGDRDSNSLLSAANEKTGDSDSGHQQLPLPPSHQLLLLQQYQHQQHQRRHPHVHHLPGGQHVILAPHQEKMPLNNTAS